MAQWYCFIGGQRYGPVSEEEMRSWVAQGRVGSADLVWTEGMPAWAPAGQAFGAAASPVPGGPPTVSMVPCPPPGGTGGATPNAQLTAQARDALRGRWVVPILFCLVIHLISQGVNTLGSMSSNVEQVQRQLSRHQRGEDPFDFRERDAPEPGLGSALQAIGGLVSLFLSGPFALSSAIFFLAVTRGGQADMGLLWAGFRNFGTALGAYLLMVLFVFLWTLLLIIPGIIAGLAYSQTFFLLAENKGLGPLEALRKSKQMMDGHKWRLFCLILRFIGWSLLCVLTCGIGFLWLGPYMAASYARFYDDLRQPSAAAPVQSPA